MNEKERLLRCSLDLTGILGDALIRSWIVDVFEAHREVLAIAVRQRARIERWHKFELAAYAQFKRAIVQEELSADDFSNSRADLTFIYGNERCDVELKTCNANWRMMRCLE